MSVHNTEIKLCSSDIWENEWNIRKQLLKEIVHDSDEDISLATKYYFFPLWKATGNRFYDFSDKTKKVGLLTPIEIMTLVFFA